MSDDKKPTIKKETFVYHKETIQYPDGREFWTGHWEGEQPPLLDRIDPEEGDLLKKYLYPPSRFYLTSEAYQAIMDALPEIERLWKAVLALPNPIYARKKDEWKAAALECYRAHSDWKLISKRMLTPKIFWNRISRNQERRDFFGGLLKEVLAEHVPGLKREFDAEILYEVAKELKNLRIAEK